MKKIALIIQREYLVRVKKKEFLVLTFLVPILIMGMMAVMIYLTLNQNDKKKVGVLDESGWFNGKLKSTANIEYNNITGNYEEIKKQFSKSGFDYFLYIPKDLSGVKLYSEKKPSALTTAGIENAINTAAQAHRLAEAHIDSAVLAAIKKPIELESKQITEEGEKDAHSLVASLVGYLCAIMIYMSLILFGVQVMRGVIEEKVSRIVEVIISSVKPFQLMLGKIIGIGLVGLTQFVLWIVLTIALTTAASVVFKDSLGNKKENIAKMQTLSNNNSLGQTKLHTPFNGAQEIFDSIYSFPIALTVGCFLFYFLFGYFLYSALFAAVGSAVDSETETQQFIFPITMPLIFTFVLSQSVIVNSPDSPLSVWLSIIPFTSPIAMMIRIQFGVPVWQLSLSMVLMVIGFVVTVWAAGRIYRVGILMYGKKPSYKELAKWFMYKS